MNKAGKKKRVAIQGIEGSYHAIAARRYYRNEPIEILGCRTFQEVASRVRDDETLEGVIAIENTIAGSLLRNHELIRCARLDVLGEHKLRISHCLAALPGTALSRVEEIGSHPMALMQCEQFLETLPSVRIVEEEDTATSARKIARGRLENHAAICSCEAARVHGLEILARGIETDKHNFTRFLFVRTRGPNGRESGPAVPERNKASLVFSLPHSVGSLARVLAILSFYEMNLTKLQSFPKIGNEWQYLFYVDLTFPDYSRYKKAIDAVLPLVGRLDILGEYAESHSGSGPRRRNKTVTYDNQHKEPNHERLVTNR